jgi:hypothetical protein
MNELNKQSEEIIDLLSKTGRQGMEGVVIELSRGDFFKAPASTKYHNCFEGGLAQHSLNVYRNLQKLNTELGCGLGEDTVRIVALLHDVCKENAYEYSTFKTKEGGKWGHKDDGFPAGHGEKSVFILLNAGLKLTQQEILLIRWHMGESDLGGMYQRMSFEEAREKEPALTALMCADLLASFVQEKRGV